MSWSRASPGDFGAARTRTLLVAGVDAMVERIHEESQLADRGEWDRFVPFT